MRGRILDYSIQKSEGIILADDGERYSFKTSEWKTESIHPDKNLQVDFTVKETEATDIYVVEEIQTKYNSTTATQNQQTSVAAIVSLIFGISGLFASWWFFAIPSIIAIITGHFARFNIKNSKTALNGDGLAIAGLVLGYMVMLFYIIIVLFFVSILGMASIKY